MALPVEELLTPGEVAKLFRVDPKTVTRWAKAGKLSSIRTLGGHRRYRAQEVGNLLSPPVLLSVDRVAEMCGVRPATIKTWTKAGKLTAARTPDGVYYNQDEVADYVLKRQVSHH